MPRKKRPLDVIEWIILHHTASTDKYSTHETLAAHLAATNLGYHYTVDDDAVFASKAAGADGKWTFKQQAPLDEVVWGAAGANWNAAHIAIDGNSITTPPTADEKRCAVQLAATVAKNLGWKKADVLGTATKPSRLQTHRWVGLNLSTPRYSTECPGPPLEAWMDEYRREVAAFLPA